MKHSSTPTVNNSDGLKRVVNMMTTGYGNRFSYSDLLPDFPKSQTSPFPGRTLGDRTPSLQHKLFLQGKKTQSGAKARQRFEKAYEGSLTMMLALTVGDSLAAKIKDFSPADAVDLMVWRFILLKKEEALNLPFVQKVIRTKLEQGDARFFIKLGLELQKTGRATRIQFNPIAFRMAQYWTHVDCPLWMMNNEAGSRFVGHLLGANVSAENYAQIIKRYGLIRFGTFPIRGTRIDKDGKFLGFEFSRWVKVKITGARFDRHGRFVGFEFGRSTKPKV